MTYCIICGMLLTTPLDTYGDLGGGWLLKRLTEAGATFLGGTPGAALMRVHRGQGCMEADHE